MRTAGPPPPAYVNGSLLLAPGRNRAGNLDVMGSYQERRKPPSLVPSPGLQSYSTTLGLHVGVCSEKQKRKGEGGKGNSWTKSPTPTTEVTMSRLASLPPPSDRG